jgi:hypothetical protein
MAVGRGGEIQAALEPFLAVARNSNRAALASSGSAGEVEVDIYTPIVSRVAIQV